MYGKQRKRIITEEPPAQEYSVSSLFVFYYNLSEQDVTTLVYHYTVRFIFTEIYFLLPLVTR